MGRNVRIVLLTVTAVMSVFVFACMLAVKPGADTAVLDQARDRQDDPILTVSQPLETSVDTLAEEKRIAETVKELLLSDEEFASSVSDKIYTGVPALVQAWLSSDDGKAMLDSVKEEGIKEAISRIVTDENIDQISMRVLESLGQDQEVLAYAESLVLDAISSPEIRERFADDAVERFYAENKDRIAADVIAEIEALTPEEKALIVSFQEAMDAYFAENADKVAAALDLDGRIAESESNSAEAYNELMRTLDREIESYYRENADAIAEDVIAYWRANCKAEEPVPAAQPAPDAQPAVRPAVPVFSEPVISGDYRDIRSERREEASRWLSSLIQ